MQRTIVEYSEIAATINKTIDRSISHTEIATCTIANPKDALKVLPIGAEWTELENGKIDAWMANWYGDGMRWRILILPE